jgi:hypothetical protein
VISSRTANSSPFFWTLVLEQVRRCHDKLSYETFARKVNTVASGRQANRIGKYGDVPTPAEMCIGN